MSARHSGHVLGPSIAIYIAAHVLQTHLWMLLPCKNPDTAMFSLQMTHMSSSLELSSADSATSGSRCSSQNDVMNELVGSNHTRIGYNKGAPERIVGCVAGADTGGAPASGRDEASPP